MEETKDKKIEEIREEEKPRGYYKENAYWSRDREDAYYDGFEIEFFWPLIKITIIMIIFLLSYKIIHVNIILSIFICIFIIAFY
jgi:hypothetical protein